MYARVRARMAVEARVRERMAVGARVCAFEHECDQD